jgi:rubrerythrin
MALYKYVDLIEPQLKTAQPLERGKWFHELLEAKYKGNNVKEVHERLSYNFTDLFDEEQEALGDLPNEMKTLYNSYQWHYRKDESWKVHEVEMKVEADLPNGMQYQGKIDMLIEDQFGLWAVDHKTHKRLPSMDFRFRDKQSVMYIWALRQCGIPVRGFIWNYVVPHAPKPLRFTQSGRLYKRQPFTDYPTVYRQLKNEDLHKDPDFLPILRDLKAVRYDPEKPQSSKVFRRDTLEKHDDMIDRVVKEATHTADRYAEYAWENRDAIERINDRSCDWCPYRHICIAELIGANADNVRRQMYHKVESPFAYYDDKRNDAKTMA